VIDGVKASPITELGHGPTVLSFQLVAAPPGEAVLVHFDADLNPDTVNANTIQIKTVDGQLIDAKVTFNADQHLARIAVKLKEGTYQLVVTTGVTDINGTPLAQEYDAPLVISR
jgi:Bacterial Ig-like domain